MPNVKDIKLRIKAVKSTQQITKAMKMVAAARIKRAETRVKAFSLYLEKIQEMVENLRGGVEEPPPYYTARPAVRKVGLLLVTADKGLCGSYNSNLIRLAQNFLHRQEQENRTVDLATLGNKGRHFFSRPNNKNSFEPRRTPYGYSLLKHRTISFSPRYQEVEEIAESFSENFLGGIWDEVWVIYAHPLSAISQKPLEKLLLPFGPSGIPYKSGEKRTVFFCEPDPETALKKILVKYFRALIYDILLKSRAAELGARLVAMGNATENAEKLLETLTLQFYRARQESITKEILEVASGAEALSG